MNLPTQFVFDPKLKRTLLGGVGLGLVCTLVVFLNDDGFHTRFWTNFLHNAVFFTGIAFMSMFFLSAQITAFAGWNAVIKRVWEAMAQFMWVGLILMGVLVAGVWGHFHHLYHWNTPGISDPNNPIYDKIIGGKAGFLNPTFFTIAVLGFLAIWYFWAFKLRQASVDQDTLETASFDYYKKQRTWAASFLPLGGFLSTVFLWLSVMSVDPHWYSTMFAWYSTASLWLAAIALTVMLIIYLKSVGYMEYVNRSHLHDLGKFMFGISVFWTYLWFDQFMLIWYANNGEETIYFNERMQHYPILFWGNLLINFVAPFLILMRNDTKRKFGAMFFVGLLVFFGHWWDFFYMIKPGARIAAFEAKELAEGKHPTPDAAPLSMVESAPAETTSADEHEENHADTHAGATAAENHADTHAGATAAEDHADTHAGATAAEDHADTHAAQATAGANEAHHATEHSADTHSETGHTAHHGPDKSFQLGYTLPGLEDLGMFIGFLCLFLFFFFNQLQKASLLPLKDPYLEESLHHDTGALIESEQGEANHAHH
jgi:hypothetical protein